MVQEFKIIEKPELTIGAITTCPEGTGKIMAYVIYIGSDRWGMTNETVIALSEGYALTLARNLQNYGLAIQQEIVHCWIEFIF